MRRLFLLSVPVCLALALAWAQEETTIKVDVDLVSVLASVRDKKGTFVKDLKKDDFTIIEDGKKQDLRYFSQESNLPMTIGLLVDVSKSQENLIEIEKRAGAQFFTSVLKNKDMAFLISFGSEAELLQDLTNSPRLLSKGLDGLRLNASVGGFGPSPTGAKQRGTIMYDAVYLAANEKLKGEVGRKVIVLITDGMDFGSRVSREEAIAAAHKADAIIYSIYYVDPRAYGWGGYSDGDLKRMSEETGGRVFRVDRRNTLEDIFQQIQEEMRSQYALGYASSNAKKDGSFRKIEIHTANKDLKVQARKGYYAGKS
ncbi:MAG: VWA domain-containing protein [Bryobacterales bacterium]|nr:VWA domain-containing protein [Bryobacterales bacterium]